MAKFQLDKDLFEIFFRQCHIECYRKNISILSSIIKKFVV